MIWRKRKPINDTSGKKISPQALYQLLIVTMIQAQSVHGTPIDEAFESWERFASRFDPARLEKNMGIRAGESYKIFANDIAASIARQTDLGIDEILPIVPSEWEAFKQDCIDTACVIAYVLGG